MMTHQMKRWTVVCIVLCSCLLSGCTSNIIRPTVSPALTTSPEPTATAVYHKITAAAAKEIIDGDKPYILLDVRTEAEYAESHISGAVLIPNTEISQRATAELPDKSATILVYCRSGNRSASASNVLVGMGYTNVYDFGGIINWPYGTVSGK